MRAMPVRPPGHRRWLRPAGRRPGLPGRQSV